MTQQIPIYSVQGAGGNVEASKNVFGRPYNEDLIHQLVNTFAEVSHTGTKSQKTRSEVSGGGAKPWRQKGTGRARSGSTRSPIWRTGGVSFAAKPVKSLPKMNKKMFRAAISTLLSALVRENRVYISNDIVANTFKTKDLKAKLSGLGGGTVLLITNGMNENLELAARNLPEVRVTSTFQLDPLNMISADHVLITADALKILEGVLV